MHARGRLDLVAVLGASGISMLGSAGSFVAVPWFVLSTTSSPAKTGLVSAVAGVGTVLSGLALSPLVDRWGHRRVSILGDVVAAGALVAVPIAGVESLLSLAALVFVSSAAAMASTTARQSMLPRLSEAAGIPLARASALYWMLQRAALAIAALPIGALILWVGPLNLLWIDAVTFLISATLVAVLITPNPNQTFATKRTLRDGWRFMRNDELISLVLATAVLLTALEAPLVTLVVPVLALSAGPSSLGLLILGYAAGMLVGALSFAVVSDRASRRALTLSCLAVVGVGYVALVTAPPMWTVAILAVMGIATGPLAPLIVSSVQRRTPPAMVGQVTGALLAIVMAAIPVGRAVVGLAIERVGLHTVLALCALAYLCTCAFLALSRRSSALWATVESGS